MKARVGLRWAWVSASVLGLWLQTAQAAGGDEGAQARQDLRIRAAPDLGSPVAGYLRRDQAVTILERRGEFARIRRADGLEGFLKSKYLTPVIAPAIGVPRPLAMPGSPAPEPAVTPGAAVVEQPAADVAETAPARAVQSHPSRWSFDVGIGAARSDVTTADLQSVLDHANFGAEVGDVDRDATNLLLRVGYRLLPQLSAELGIEWTDDYRFDLSSDATRPQELLDVVAATLPASGTGLSASLAYTLERGAFSAQARIGAYAGVDNEFEASLQGQRYKAEQSQQSLLLGANVAWRFAGEWSLGLELQRLDLNAELLQTRAFLRYAP